MIILKTHKRVTALPLFTCSLFSLSVRTLIFPAFASNTKSNTFKDLLTRRHSRLDSSARLSNTNVVTAFFADRLHQPLFKSNSDISSFHSFATVSVRDMKVKDTSPVLRRSSRIRNLTMSKPSSDSNETLGEKKKKAKANKEAKSVKIESTLKRGRKPKNSNKEMKENISNPTSSEKRKRQKPTPSAKQSNNKKDETSNESYLPRTRESYLIDKSKSNSEESCNLLVMGIDEAGRGPLAGPVVAAAAIVPTNIPGIVDSKKVVKEEERERLFELIINSPGVRWAASIVDAQRIDEINILQATLEGMSKAAETIVNQSQDDSTRKDGIESLSVKRSGCYIISSGSVVNEINTKYYALVDGNRVPKTMSCDSEPIVKGDSKEYAIAAASIIAKVVRDRLMNEYHELYPEYNLIQHKGYPTAAHMGVVKKIGATPIHRRTFAPLKHMELDEDGKIIG